MGRGALCLASTVMLARIVKREVIHGWLERRSGKDVPPLIGSLVSGLVIFIGICLILAFVFQRDVTALVATGGASLMILGIALRDVMLALFTGILLNVEKPFQVGDQVRINDRPDGQGRAHHLAHHGAADRRQRDRLRAQPAALQRRHPQPGPARQPLQAHPRAHHRLRHLGRKRRAHSLRRDAGGGGRDACRPPRCSPASSRPTACSHEVAFTIGNYGDGKKAEHAVIKSILQCMRDADIGIAFPKAGSITIEGRTRIANRSLDVFHLVQQVRLFRGLPQELCPSHQRCADRAPPSPAGAAIVQAGERRHSLFIVGEGMAKRTASDREGASVEEQRFIATEFFGRKALFACQPHNATVTAETALLMYEFDRRALRPADAPRPPR